VRVANSHLVEEERRRPVHELGRDREPLLLTAREALAGRAADAHVRAAVEPERPEELARQGGVRNTDVR
jgi:hypothetical protein